MSVGLSIARTLWARHRIGLSIVLTYWALTIPVLLSLKQSSWQGIVMALLSMGLIVGGFYMITVFVHSDSDVAIPGSTYPSHYFTLPVKTSALLLWPVLLGCLCLGSTTFLLGLALRSSGFSFSPFDVTLAILALLTCLQAIFWFPVGIAYSKLFLSIFAVAAVLVIANVPELLNSGPGPREALFGVMILGSVLASWRGLARARFGHSYFNWTPSDAATVARSPRRALPPFGSPDRAQVWYEWRQHGRILPILALVMFGLFLIPYAFNDTLSPIYQLTSRSGRYVLSVPSFLMVYGPTVLVLMAVYGWGVGCGAKRTDLRRGDRTFQLFFGTRPMRDEAMVWAKLKASALSTLCAWGLLALCVLPILLANGGMYEGSQPIDGFKAPLYRLLPEFVSGPNAWRCAIAIGVLVFLTWRNYAIGFWAEVSGSLFYRYAQPMFSGVLYVVLATLPHEAVNWLLFERLTWILGIVLVVKLAVVVALGVRLLRNGLLSGWSAMNLGIGYVAAASALSLGVLFIYHDVPETPRLLLIFLCSLAVPIFRILLAIPMLSKNRHR